MFSTNDVLPGQRLEYWREMVLECFVAIDVTPIGGGHRRGEFAGGAEVRELGSLQVARIRASSMSAARSARHVARSSDDDYFIALHLTGIARATQDGRSTTLHPGDIALFDSTRPYLIEFRHERAFEHLIFRAPRAELDARCAGLARATAVRVSAASGEGSITAPFLRRLAELESVAGRASPARLAGTGLDLLATALSAAAQLAPDPETRQRARFQELKRHVLARLGEAELSPATVARAQFMSVRQVHRLFAGEQTTFGEFVRDERLRLCARDLADEKLGGVPVADIAARWGYRSPPHFTRSFTARFGVGPREFRRRAAFLR